MSVSAFNQSIAPSLDNASLADAKAITKRPAAASTAQLTTGINFTSQPSHCGPVFGGPPPRPLPDNLRPNPGPPPRPSPALPDPHYSKRSNEQLAQELLNNYKAFKGRWPSRTVTRQSLQKMADRPLTGNPDTDAHIRLAKELLKRPGLMQALDRNCSTGALDGRLTKDDIRSFIGSGNSLKLSGDKQFVQEMLKIFNRLLQQHDKTL